MTPGRLSFAIALVFAIPLAGNPSLRTSADEAHILIGTAVRPALFSEPAYSDLLAREFNMIEAEDAMKWRALRPTAGQFDFSAGDRIVQFAQAHKMRGRNMKVRGHCLVWDHDNPDWLTQSSFAPPQMARLLHQHIKSVLRHYTGKVFAWDVVNEAFDEHGQLRDSPWYNRPGIGMAGQGTAYIEQAFRWARQSDPHALLFYNDNGGEGLGAKSDAIYAMARDFEHRGVPIDGIGLQMHISHLDLDTAAIAANIARLTALGLQVQITEFDVSLPVDSTGHATADDLQRQADLYRAIFRTCLSNPGCTAIQTWGFTDKFSWIGSHTHGARGAALLFDAAGKPKPAYEAALEELSRRPGAQ